MLGWQTRLRWLTTPVTYRAYAQAAATRMKAAPPSFSNRPSSTSQPSSSKVPPKAKHKLQPAPQPASSAKRKKGKGKPTTPILQPVQQTKQKKARRKQTPQLPIEEGPLRDATYFASQKPHSISALQQRLPVQEFNNFHSGVFISSPSWAEKRVLVEGQTVHRLTHTFIIPMNGKEFTAVGDGRTILEARHNASLDALYQLANAQLLNLPAVKLASKSCVLSDGTMIDSVKARSFIDFYCRRYGFGRPDLAFDAVGGMWEATLSVNGRRVGIGSSLSKKSAEDACFLDAANYLERCDTKLWEVYIEAARSGQELGMGPAIPFFLASDVHEDVRGLCSDMLSSDLFKASASAVPAATVNTMKTFLRPPSDAQSEIKSKSLQDALAAYYDNPQMETMRNAREALPVYSKIQDVLTHIEENEVTILMAATGSGKTTQVPQLILEHFTKLGQGSSCNVMCTQPRRLAAISVATRVANERGEPLGRSIGYQVRFEARLPQPHGSVTFCTTGIFLKLVQSQLDGTSNKLDTVTHIVVDEVHERDVDTDLLLVVLKRLMALRKTQGNPLKVILMSATVDPTLFQQYFADQSGEPAKIISIPGRSYPVKQHFLDDFISELHNSPLSWALQTPPSQKYLATELSDGSPQPSPETEESALGGKDHEVEVSYPLVAATISHVMQKTDDGHCLVFLPGWDDMVGVQRVLQKPEGPLGIDFSSDSYSLHLLHSSVPLAEQQRIFEPAPEGHRRIILSTTIAETSVTIPDVVYVVDTARLKEVRYNPQKHMSALVSAWVGRSNLFQRAGRAGRHRPGEYYGLLSRAHCDALAPSQTVEMKRVDLSNVVMHIKAMNFADMTVEEVLAQAIEPPSPPNIRLAIQNLQASGALDSEKQLTSLGRVLLKLPIEVQLGRLILYGSFFRCLDRALSLAALLSNREPFLSPMHLKKESHKVKKSWAPPHYQSDVIASLRAFEAWWALHSKGRYVAANQFCSDNFLSKPTLLMVAKVKDQILQTMHRLGVLEMSGGGQGTSTGRIAVPPELDINGDNLPLLSALITLAVQPKVAVQTSPRSFRVARDKGVIVHPTSVNHKKRTGSDDQEGSRADDERQLVVYSESRVNMTAGDSNPQTYLSGTTRIDPLVYLLFGAVRIKSSPRGLECDDWMPLVGHVRMLDDVLKLKSLMEACFLRVFEGVLYRSETTRTTVSPDSPESEWEDDSGYFSLTPTEIQELGHIARHLVSILSQYAISRGVEPSLEKSLELRPQSFRANRSSKYMGVRSPRLSF